MITKEEGILQSYYENSFSGIIITDRGISVKFQLLLKNIGPDWREGDSVVLEFYDGKLVTVDGINAK